MKIKARLSLLFALGTALLIGVGGAVFVHAMWIGLDGGLLSGLQVRAAAIQQDLHAGPLVGSLPNRGTPTDLDEASQVLVRSDGRVTDLAPGGGPALFDLTQWARARRGTMELVVRLERSESPLMVWAVPDSFGGGAVIAVASSTDTVDAATDRVETALLIGGPVGVLLAGLAAWLVAAAALRPVERMRAQAARMASSLSRRGLDVPSTHDEIAALGHTLNEMIGAVQAASDRQSAFVSAAGHELRTPLSKLKLELELAARPGRTREEMSSAIEEAVEEADRLGRLAEDLLLLASQDEGQRVVLTRPCDLATVMANSVAGFASAARRKQVRLDCRLPESAPAQADPERLRQVADNLLDNALRFAPSPSTISVEMALSGGECTLRVSDGGPGFPPDFLPHAFERFSLTSDSRTRSRPGGAGLGLAIVESIVRAHGGEVRASNRPEGGAEVLVRLPVNPAEPEGGRTPHTEATTSPTAAAPSPAAKLATTYRAARR